MKLSFVAAILAALLISTHLSVAAKLSPSSSVYPFTCDYDTTIWVRCTSKVNVNGVDLCYGDTFRAEDGTITDPSTGYDPCQSTQCLGLYCDDTVATELHQLYESEPEKYYNSYVPYQHLEPMSVGLPACTCVSSNLGASDPYALRIRSSSPYSPKDNEVCSSIYTCSDDTMYLDTSSDESGCSCCYKPTLVLNYAEPSCGVSPMLITTTSSPDGTSTTPDPLTPDAAAYLNATRDFQKLCVNTPSSLSEAIFTSRINDICCRVYTSYDTYTEQCGSSMFYLPLGPGYCHSSIPDNEFCCQFEVMLNRTYVYRGATCRVPSSSMGRTSIVLSLLLLAATTFFVAL